MNAVTGCAVVLTIGGGVSPAPEAPPVPFPHPLITEILYAVPNTPGTDPNLDGVRHAAGDEFVELINPHDKPIQLFGYTLTDRNPEGKGQFKFTFPALELPPGGVVLVFNGFEATWSGVGPVGDAKGSPEASNGSFHNAHVFTAAATSARTSFANEGDFVLLSDPGNQPVQCVHWGEFSEKVPEALLTESAPTTAKGSIERESLSGPFKVRPVVKNEAKSAYSAGKFDSETPVAAKPEAPGSDSDRPAK